MADLKSIITNRVCLGNGGALRFDRVMPGEYRCEIGEYTYTVDHIWFGCECSGEMIWKLQRHHGYRTWQELGHHRTLGDAKIAAELDAVDIGLVNNG